MVSKARGANNNEEFSKKADTVYGISTYDRLFA